MMSIPLLLCNLINSTELIITFSLFGATLIYTHNKQFYNNVLTAMTWGGLRFITKIQLYSYNMFRNNCLVRACFNNCLKEKPHSDIFFIREGEVVLKVNNCIKDIADFYNHHKQLSYELIIYKTNDYIDNEDKAKEYKYMRFSVLPLNEINLCSSDNLFITGQITCNNKTYAINNFKHLCNKNTVIFDRVYTQWYLNYFYNTQIYDEKYEIEVIDININTIKFNDNKYIKITDTNYLIEDFKALTIRTAADDLEDNELVWRNLTQSDIEPNEINNNDGNTSVSSEGSYEVISPESNIIN